MPNGKYLITQDANLTTRDDEANGPVIEGYFAVFGAEYWPFGRDKEYSWVETIDPGAFDLTRDRDVRALVNHDSTLVLGRTTTGTLELRVDQRGLYGTIHVNPEDPDAMALYARVKRGDVSQCSFGFNIRNQELVTGLGKADHVILKDVELWEVSCCTFPAYDETEISARAKEVRAESDRAAEQRRALWRQNMHSKLEGEQDA
jgi:HK97 family phage prohead protease